MEIKRDDILNIEKQLNNLEPEVRNLENSFIQKDLKKFNETQKNIILIQKEINILTTPRG